MFTCFQVILYLYHSLSITAGQQECQYRSNNLLKLNLMEWWMSALNVQYISTELKSRDTSCSLSSSSPLPPLKAVVFYPFEFPHVSQSEASGRLGTYLT